MTVGDLRKAMKDLPDNMPVLTPGHDHSFFPAAEAKAACVEFAPNSNGGDWFEYWDDNNMSEGSEKKQAFIVS